MYDILKQYYMNNFLRHYINEVLRYIWNKIKAIKILKNEINWHCLNFDRSKGHKATASKRIRFKLKYCICIIVMDTGINIPYYKINYINGVRLSIKEQGNALIFLSVNFLLNILYFFLRCKLEENYVTSCETLWDKYNLTYFNFLWLLQSYL